MLKNYYVRDAKTARNSPFTFKEDGFYRTLKRTVRDEIEKLPTNLSNHTDMIMDGLLVTCLVASALSCWATNYWLVMGSYIVASVSLGWAVIAAHNYLHRRTNWRMYIFNLSLWSYRYVDIVQYYYLFDLCGTIIKVLHFSGILESPMHCHIIFILTH